MGYIKISRDNRGVALGLEIWRFNAVLRAFYKPKPVTTAGIRNSTKDGYRLLFLDYDKILYEEMLLPELDSLQERHELSDFYVFQSNQRKGGYHVICLDKLHPKEWLSIFEEANCDENYKRVIELDQHTSVLRVFPKGNSQAPTLKTIIKSPYNNRVKSKAHALFLKYHHNIKIGHLRHLDDSTELLFTKYETLKYIKN